MRRELRYGLASLRRRPALGLAAWSIPEMLPTMGYGLAVAHAVDDGFLAGRPDIGLAWLGGLLAAATAGAVGSRQVYRRLGGLVEPVRDDLVSRVVSGALRGGVAGRRDDGSVARLTRQVEIVRDTYAGMVLVLRSFMVSVAGVVTGLLAIEPVIALLVLPPFLLGFAASVAILGLAAGRVRASIRADEELTTAAGAVFTGVRDVTAGRAEAYAASLVAKPIEAQAAAERALARVAMLRTGCFALGGWGPLLVLLAAAPWLTGRGMTAGTLMGGLTYVLIGLQPALLTVMGALGDSGLRFVVTLGRILDTEVVPAVQGSVGPDGHGITIRGLTFSYGPAAEPVLHDLDLTVREGEHLAVVGPSGIGKSTLAGLICGLLTPGDGRILLGGVPAIAVTAEARVLIPQEAYVFSDTLRANLTYLCPTASPTQVRRAVYAVGAGALLGRPGGLDALIRPGDLSAGERQLVALVRAYLCPAPLAVLDEATCHLDPEAERQAEEAFAARAGTLVVIAHRISSALRADRILVLDGSRATVGDHATLLDTSPLYRELLGHWQSDPTGVLGDPDRLDPGAGPGLGQDPGQIVPDRAGAQ